MCWLLSQNMGGALASGYFSTGGPKRLVCALLPEGVLNVDVIFEKFLMIPV